MSIEGRGRNGDRNNRRGRNRGRSRSRQREPSRTRNDIVCWNCNESGHFRNQCKAQKDNKEVHVATDSDDDVLIYATESPVKSPVEDWVMDSGASFHSTPCSRNMKNLRLGNFGSVRLADGAILDVTGIGDVDLKTSLGTTWTLKSVRLIPYLTRMLLSMGQLDDQAYYVNFGNGQ